jgi:hypothetical protein
MFVFYSDLEQRFKQGAGSLAEGAREPDVGAEYGPDTNQ